MKETSVDGCLYYTFDLWEEPEHATLKSLCLGWARDIDPAVNLSVIDWNGIELRAAERSGALSHDQFVDKIRQLFGGTIEVVDRYVARASVKPRKFFNKRIVEHDQFVFRNRSF